MDTPNNKIILMGKVLEAPVFNHDVQGEKFMRMKLQVERLSKAMDILPVTISERLLTNAALEVGSQVAFTGQIRAYNIVGTSNEPKLNVTAFAQAFVDNETVENPNVVELEGTICKVPNYRTTPFGREIADVMLAVNRNYGKSDYIPCIVWGRNASFVANLKVGTKVKFKGRFQSREYTKQLENGETINRVAYEVSVNNVSIVKAEEKKPGQENTKAPEKAAGEQHNKETEPEKEAVLVVAQEEEKPASET